MSSESNCYEIVVLPNGGYEEGERIWVDTWPWWTKQMAWICESLAEIREEPHKLRRYMKARQECVRPRARVCISYNAVMSIYIRVSEISIPCPWVHCRYPSVSKCMYPERLRQYMPYYAVANHMTVTKMNMINKMPGGCGTLITTTVRIWYQVSCRACAEVSAAREVSCRSALMSHVLLKSPADLRRGVTSFNLWLLYSSNHVAFWIHLHKWRCFQEHLRLLL